MVRIRTLNIWVCVLDFPIRNKSYRGEMWVAQPSYRNGHSHFLTVGLMGKSILMCGTSVASIAGVNFLSAIEWVLIHC